MRRFFQHGHNLAKRFDIGSAYPSSNRTLQCQQVTVDPLRKFSSFRRQSNNKGPPIRFADVAFDQSAFGQPVKNTGERRSLVRETAMKIGHVSRSRLSEHRQNVCFALGQPALAQVIQVKANSMGSAMDWMNKSKRHDYNGFRSGSTQECRASSLNKRSIE